MNDDLLRLSSFLIVRGSLSLLLDQVRKRPSTQRRVEVQICVCPSIANPIVKPDLMLVSAIRDATGSKVVYSSEDAIVLDKAGAVFDP